MIVITTDTEYYQITKKAMALSMQDSLTEEERTLLDEYNDALERYFDEYIKDRRYN